jgi:toxin-antitoxin system PIN domain toxin
VKIVDLNILIYAVNQAALQHVPARHWWEAALNGNESIGLPWIVILGFLRLTTSPRTFASPCSVEDSLELIEEWLAQPTIELVRETDEHYRILGELLRKLGAGGNLTTDAHLAALAIGHGATLVTCDSDFSRFSNLRWENPLAAS